MYSVFMYRAAPELSSINLVCHFLGKVIAHFDTWLRVETSDAFTDQTDNIKADSAELDSTGHYMLHLKMFMFSYLKHCLAQTKFFTGLLVIN